MNERPTYEYLCITAANRRRGYIAAKHEMVFIKDKPDLLEFWSNLSRAQKSIYRFYDISDNMKAIKKTVNYESLVV
jgi:hypothetical protein